jgi:hypothetical protein
VVSLGEWALRCWSFMGMIGYFGIGLIWACMKVADCCDPSSAGTLTCIKSIEYVCECIFASDCV